jgi:hypothetical protein
MENIKNTSVYYYIKRLIDEVDYKINNFGIINSKCNYLNFLFYIKDNLEYQDNELTKIKEKFIKKINECKLNNLLITEYKYNFISILDTIISNIHIHGKLYWYKTKIYDNLVNYRNKIFHSSDIKSFVIVYGIYDNLCYNILKIYYIHFINDILCYDFIRTFNLSYYFNILNKLLLSYKINQKLQLKYHKYYDYLNNNILLSEKFKKYYSSILFNNNCEMVLFILKFILKYYSSY